MKVFKGWEFIKFEFCLRFCHVDFRLVWFGLVKSKLIWLIHWILSIFKYLINIYNIDCLLCWVKWCLLQSTNRSIRRYWVVWLFAGYHYFWKCCRRTIHLIKLPNHPSSALLAFLSHRPKWCRFFPTGRTLSANSHRQRCHFRSTASHASYHPRLTLVSTVVLLAGNSSLKWRFISQPPLVRRHYLRRRDHLHWCSDHHWDRRATTDYPHRLRPLSSSKSSPVTLPLFFGRCLSEPIPTDVWPNGWLHRYHWHRCRQLYQKGPSPDTIGRRSSLLSPDTVGFRAEFRPVFVAVAATYNSITSCREVSLNSTTGRHWDAVHRQNLFGLS